MTDHAAQTSTAGLTPPRAPRSSDNPAASPPLPHGDVERFTLLRHEGDPRAVPSRRPQKVAVLALDDRTATAIYGLYISGTYLLSLDGAGLRTAWSAQNGRVVGRHPDHGRNALLRVGSTQLFFAGLVSHRVRRRSSEAEHQRGRRAALPRGGSRRTPVLHLLHGRSTSVHRWDRRLFRGLRRNTAGARVCRPGRRHAAAWCSSSS